MRSRGDRAVRGGDRRLSDRGYGLLRSGDPLSCVCTPGSGGGGTCTFVAPTAVTAITFAGITVCPGCVRITVPFFGEDRSTSGLSNTGFNTTIALAPFFGSFPWTNNTPGNVLAGNRFDTTDCSGTPTGFNHTANAAVYCFYNNACGYTIFYAVNIGGVGPGGSGFDCLLFYADAIQITSSIPNQLTTCGQSVPAGQPITANYIGIATGGTATLTVTP